MYPIEYIWTDLIANHRKRHGHWPQEQHRDRLCMVRHKEKHRQRSLPLLMPELRHQPRSPEEIKCEISSSSSLWDLLHVAIAFRWCSTKGEPPWESYVDSLCNIMSLGVATMECLGMHDGLTLSIRWFAYRRAEVSTRMNDLGGFDTIVLCSLSTHITQAHLRTCDYEFPWILFQSMHSNTIFYEKIRVDHHIFWCQNILGWSHLLLHHSLHFISETGRYSPPNEE